MAGEIMCYYAANAESRKSIFVCEGAKDLWRLWQELRGSDLDRELLLVTSTHGSAFPGEWQDPGYWSSWDRVCFGQDSDSAGERIVFKLVEQVGRDGLRVRIPHPARMPPGAGRRSSGFTVPRGKGSSYAAGRYPPC